MSRLWQAILELIRTIGNYSGCHQMPERSFFYKGKQFPVCARCTGVFLGEVIAVISGIFRKKTKSAKISTVFLGLMGLDWGIQEAGIKESNNRRRFITGLLGGYGLYTLYIIGFKKIFCLVKKKENI